MKKKCLALFFSALLMLGTFGIRAPAVSAEHILFLPHRGGTFNIIGRYNGNSIPTDFGNAYQAVAVEQQSGALLRDAVLSVSAEYIDDKSLKATILLENRSSRSAAVKIALHGDSKVNQSDTPPLFLIPQDVKKSYALRVCETTADGYQCTYRFRGVGGSPDAATVWLGRFDERYDNFWNNGTATVITGMDSGMAISWQNLQLPASGSVSVSFEVAVEPANLAELPAMAAKPKVPPTPAPTFGPLPTLAPIEKLAPIGGVTSDWKSVLRKIERSAPGSVISVKMDQDSLMPIEVLERLQRIKDVSLRVSDEEGNSFVLNESAAKQAMPDRPYNLESLNQLAQAAAKSEEDASSAPASSSESASLPASTPAASAQGQTAASNPEDAKEREQSASPSAGAFALQPQSEQTGYLPAGDSVPDLLGYLRRADISPVWAPDIRANTGVMDRLYRAVLSAEMNTLSAQDKTDCIAYLSQWQQVLGKPQEQADQLAHDLID